MHLARDAARSFLRSVFQKIDAGPVRGRAPFPQNAARRRAIREDEHATFSGHVKDRRSSSLCGVATRARVGDTRCVERAQRLGQAVIAPVEDMIVREAAAVDVRRGDAVDVARMHAVMNLLAAPVVLAGSDACLKIDDAQIHAGTIEFGQRIAPYVIGRHRPRDRAVHTLSQCQVEARFVDTGFVQRGIVWMSQGLIDPAARHHVAAEEKPNRLRLRR